MLGRPVVLKLLPASRSTGLDARTRLLRESRRSCARAAHADAGAVPAADRLAPAGIGILRVIGGRSDRSENTLDSDTATIGKSTSALVRLRGWFKPKLAASIERLGDGYVVSVVGGRVLVNGQRLRGCRGLVHGDLLEVAGLLLEFRSKQAKAP